ncbi:MAG: hypothetical protein JW395_1230 [Nitrospira sp.]|nr:hypothetical protein [Nitrospira sp.]
MPLCALRVSVLVVLLLTAPGCRTFEGSRLAFSDERPLLSPSQSRPTQISTQGGTPLEGSAASGPRPDDAAPALGSLLRGDLQNLGPGPLVFVSGTKSGVWVIDGANYRMVGELDLSFYVGNMVLSPDGNQLWLLGQGSSLAWGITVVDVKTMSTAAVITLADWPKSVAFSPDNKVAYVNWGQGTGMLSVFSTSSFSELQTIRMGTTGVDAAVNRDGTRMYATTCGGVLVEVDLTRLAVVDQIPIAHRCEMKLALHPDGRRLYVGSYEATSLQMFDTITRQSTSTFLRGQVVDFRIDPGGDRLYSAGGQSGRAYISYIDDNRDVASIFTGGFLASLAVHPEGGRIFVANRDLDAINVIDTDQNSIVATIELPLQARPDRVVVGARPQ